MKLVLDVAWAFRRAGLAVADAIGAVVRRVMNRKRRVPMPQYLVIPSHDGQLRFEDLRSARVMEGESPGHVVGWFYGHAIVIPCEVFPQRES